MLWHLQLSRMKHCLVFGVRSCPTQPPLHPGPHDPFSLAVVYGADKTKWALLRTALRRGEVRDGPVTLGEARRRVVWAFLAWGPTVCVLLRRCFACIWCFLRSAPVAT